MGHLKLDPNTLSLTQQVLERQHTHAQAVATYLPANADIGDSTGLLLSMFDKLSRETVTYAGGAARTLGALHTDTAAAVGAAGTHIQDTDRLVHQVFSDLLSTLSNTCVPPPAYPELPGPVLGAAGESAPGDYGHVAGMFVEKTYESGKDLVDAVGDAGSLIDQALSVGQAGPVTELVNASSYLVPGQAPENPVSDLRWSAGALLGSIDWVAEQFLGYSILNRYVFKPFAGDWEGLYCASQAWHHAGDALSGIAKNDSGLVARTTAGWQGLSGDAFRGAATALVAASLKLGTAYGAAGDIVKLISSACKLACSAIGKALKLIADQLLKMAAEAATPVAGWVVGAATAYKDIQDVIKNARRIDAILETLADAIKNFVEAKTDILDSVALIENLAQGAIGSVKAPAA